MSLTNAIWQQVKETETRAPLLVLSLPLLTQFNANDRLAIQRFRIAPKPALNSIVFVFVEMSFTSTGWHQQKKNETRASLLVSGSCPS
jgi:hypothetical protein